MDLKDYLTVEEVAKRIHLGGTASSHF